MGKVKFSAIKSYLGAENFLEELLDYFGDSERVIKLITKEMGVEGVNSFLDCMERLYGEKMIGK